MRRSILIDSISTRGVNADFGIFLRDFDGAGMERRFLEYLRSNFRLEESMEDLRI